MWRDETTTGGPLQRQLGSINEVADARVIRGRDGRKTLMRTSDIDGVPSRFSMVLAGDCEQHRKLENGFVNSGWYS